MNGNGEPIDWAAYEQELAAADTVAAVDVDEPVLADSAPDVPAGAQVRSVARRPVLPGWARSGKAFLATARWVAGYTAHMIAFHTVRMPVYAGRLLWRSPVGLARMIGGWWGWTWDSEGRPVRQAAVRREEALEYLRLSAQRDNRVRLRVALQLPALIVACCLAYQVAQWPAMARFGLLAGLLLAAGWAGMPADKPLIGHAVTTFKAPRLTSDVVVRALSVLGIAGITQALAKNGKAVGFAAPITRDGPGWRADVDLPAGVTAGEVIDRRDKLASGLARPLGCVWPEAAHDIHPGRLILWVGDRDMAATKQPAWPLARTGTADLFKPFAVGTDPRGRVVNVELMFTNVLIGSIPGMGKTFTLRLPLLAAALDPIAEVQVFELKGTGDLDPLSLIASRYASGADDDTVHAAYQALKDLRQECQRRAKVIKGLPKAVCPENKVTPQLAKQKSLGLHPLMVAVDECQELFTHPDVGKEAGELAEKIIKLGRALGVILLLATQRPDAKSLPTGITANVGTRLCLRVMGQTENDMILGTSMYRNGVRATMFTTRDKGVAYLAGASDEPQIVKTFYVDNPAAEKICQRAKQAREAAGTLTGHAAGVQVPAQRASSLLDDLATVFPADEVKAWSETLTELLSQLNPDQYGGWSPEQLTAALKPHGIDTVQIGRRVEGKTVNRRGITRSDLAAALTERDRNRRSD